MRRFAYILFAAAISATLTVNRAPAQTRAWADSILLQLGTIAVEPLDILPVSDCRLDNLEQLVADRTGQNSRSGRAVFSSHPLMRALQAKRAVIDFKRSHIDSLYYIQALQEINVPEPDYDRAMRFIEKSLQFNRFYARSVVFKMNHLLKRERNAQQCLRYLNATLREFASNAKVNNAAQTTYNTLLEQAGMMVANGLYQDALDLCRLITLYCQEGFPIRYQKYKETQLENLAYQGIYRSYYDVAQTAFRQERWQMAQEYAVKAYRFYLEHEPFMAGVNYAIELLDRIAGRYLEFAALSDSEESCYYRRLVEDIVKETGLDGILCMPYNPDNDIAADLALLSSSAPEPEEEAYHPPVQVTPLHRQDKTEATASADKPTLSSRQPRKGDGKAEPESASIPNTPVSATATGGTPVSATATDGTPVKLSPSQALKQYTAAWEQANLLRAKRRFLDAGVWLDAALRLQKTYSLKTEPEFADVYARNTVQTVEQLLNKAVFRIWNDREAEADSLHLQAQRLVTLFSELYSEDESTPILLQQLLLNYRNRRDESNCKKLDERMGENYTRFYRQVSYGNIETSRAELASLCETYAQYGQDPYASCAKDSLALKKACTLLSSWESYLQAMRQAVQYLTDSAETENFDIARLVDSYTQAVRLYDSLSLRGTVSAPVSLFSRLSNAHEYRLLNAWSILCRERGDMEQSTFIYDYLTAQNYKDLEFEKHGRQLKKNRERKRKGGEL